MRELTNRAEITRGSNRTLLFLVVNRGHICVRWMNPMRPSSVGFAIPTPPSQPPGYGTLAGGWEGGEGRPGYSILDQPRPSFEGCATRLSAPRHCRTCSGNPGAIRSEQAALDPRDKPWDDDRGPTPASIIPLFRTIYFPLSKLFSIDRARIFPPDANKTFWRYGP